MVLPRSSSAVARPFVVACILAVAALAPLARGQAPKSTAKNSKRAIADYMASCEALGWSGVVLVRKQGKAVYFEAHGLADRETGRLPVSYTHLTLPTKA